MQPVHPTGQATAPTETAANGWRHRCLYSGTQTHPVYADLLIPERTDDRKLPLILIHGAFHTGAAYLTTPDGRPGWAPWFVRTGRRVYVVDWPGHGRSPAGPDFHRLSGVDIVESLAVLIREIGPCLLLAHSAGGPIAWQLAEQLPEHVKGIVGIAPGGPANIQPALPSDPDAIAALRFDQAAGCPIYSDPDLTAYVDIDFIRNYWANTPRFPVGALNDYARSIVGESPRILNERFRIGGAGLTLDDPGVVARRPILIVTGELDPRHPRDVDEKVARYLNADFQYLPDMGFTGNGHMLMLDDNSDDIASVIDTWLDNKRL